MAIKGSYESFVLEIDIPAYIYISDFKHYNKHNELNQNNYVTIRFDNFIVTSEDLLLINQAYIEHKAIDIYLFTFIDEYFLLQNFKGFFIENNNLYVKVFIRDLTYNISDSYYIINFIGILSHEDS